MNPVLAQQEIHIFELRRCQLQAEVQRDQCLRMKATGSPRTVPVSPRMITSVRAWFGAVGVRAVSFGPRSAAAVAKETTGLSV